MEKKIFEFEFKQLGEEGEFAGYLSTFGNVDGDGDIVEPGAFRKTLKEQKNFPLLWSHSAANPNLVIGSFQGEEDEKGLLIKGEYFLELEGGRQAYQLTKKLISKGIKTGLSMGYKAIKYDFGKVNGTSVRRLKEVRLYEGSITLFPLNEQARVEFIKQEQIETKPYPNYHSCRLNDPKKYIRFRQMKREHNGKEYIAIIGFKKGGGSEDQAYRYHKEIWTEAEAREHCKDHDGAFEAAEKGVVECESCKMTLDIEPSEGTHVNEPSIFSPIIKVLEEGQAARGHLLKNVLKTLEKI